ncbi:MAG: methyltransferase domain-containing protein [Hyphomicrobiaceae bacterium]|nr:methyltransferase domain-containing protein [Hyphomicrobiaceae bacterium]
MQNRPYVSMPRARNAATGRLEIRRCDHCGFVWNQAFDLAKVQYDESYDNCQSFSEAFQKHISGRIGRIAELAHSRSPLAIVEVGCGQADFLSAVVEVLGPERVSHAIGFDPAFNGQDGGLRGPCTIYKRYLDPNSLRSAGVEPDLIISRHTIEHVPRPIEFLEILRSSIGMSKAGLVIETPNVDWILRNRVVHDFFYEHCSLFSFGSMAEALERSGFEPTRMETVFGGQYLWVEAVPSDNTGTAAADWMQGYMAKWAHHISDRIGRGDKIAVWGAGAKGVTFVGTIDPQCSSLACLIDKNTTKQDRFLPVTGHPIVSPQTAVAMGVTHVLIMNPEYSDEIAAELRQLQSSATFLVVE